ncbi:MAG: hypothetical protein JO250_13140 [Armatimonadetes bacterium]|nr:hypothetical protein [Armatimonadota bacterium]
MQTIPVGQDYLILRADKAAPAGIPPLGRIKPQVTRLARLEKADPPAVEIARLYQAARPQFNVAKYESYFDDLSQLDVKTAAGKKTASIR